MQKTTTCILLFILSVTTAQARELGGITVDDQILMPNGETLVLNGMGLREKIWIDIYAGSLYLPKKVTTVHEVISQPGAMRIQLDFIYKEILSEKIIKAWKDGFEKNQPPKRLKIIQDRVNTFYTFFTEDIKKGDQFIFDYIPEKGVTITKNKTALGTIKGEPFKSALLEIWLGNKPADKGLKKGMLGRD